MPPPLLALRLLLLRRRGQTNTKTIPLLLCSIHTHLNKKHFYRHRQRKSVELSCWNTFRWFYSFNKFPYVQKWKNKADTESGRAATFENRHVFPIFSSGFTADSRWTQEVWDVWLQMTADGWMQTKTGQSTETEKVKKNILILKKKNRK